MSRGAWTVRPYQRGDEDAIVKLFALTFGKPITTEHWLWKFRAYQLPFENVWLAFDQDKLIFHFAGIPLRIFTARGIRWAVLTVDSMCDPGYRRRGLLTELAGNAFSSWRNAGAVLAYGLPNKQLAPGFDKLGYKHAFPVRWRRYLIRPFATLARRSVVPLPATLLDGLWNAARWSTARSSKGIELVEATDADASFDEIPRPFVPGHVLSFVHDRDWIRWRYVLAPEFRYRLLVARRANETVGYVAYRIKNNVGTIAEVVSRDGNVWCAVVGGAIEHLRNLGAESASILAVPGAEDDRRYKKMRFLPSARFGFGVVPLAPDMSREYVSNPNSWCLCGGDFDVI